MNSSSRGGDEKEMIARTASVMANLSFAIQMHPIKTGDLESNERGGTEMTLAFPSAPHWTAVRDSCNTETLSRLVDILESYHKELMQDWQDLMFWVFVLMRKIHSRKDSLTRMTSQESNAISQMRMATKNPTGFSLTQNVIREAINVPYPTSNFYESNLNHLQEAVDERNTIIINKIEALNQRFISVVAPGAAMTPPPTTQQVQDLRPPAIVYRDEQRVDGLTPEAIEALLKAQDEHREKK